MCINLRASTNRSGCCSIKVVNIAKPRVVLTSFQLVELGTYMSSKTCHTSAWATKLFCKSDWDVLLPKLVGL